MIPRTDDPALKFAAQDSSEYLKQITGEPVTREDPGARHHIYLGEIPANAPAAEATHLCGAIEKLQEDGSSSVRWGLTL